jgi:hypothetical protein
VRPPGLCGYSFLGKSTRPVTVHGLKLSSRKGEVPTSIMSSPSTALPSATPSATTSSMNCGNGGGADTYQKLRIASVFIILIGSLMGASFPVLSKRHHQLYVPKAVFECVHSFWATPSIANTISFDQLRKIFRIWSDCEWMKGFRDLGH